MEQTVERTHPDIALDLMKLIIKHASGVEAAAWNKRELLKLYKECLRLVHSCCDGQPQPRTQSAAAAVVQGLAQHTSKTR